MSETNFGKTPNYLLVGVLIFAVMVLLVNIFTINKTFEALESFDALVLTDYSSQLEDLNQSINSLRQNNSDAEVFRLLTEECTLSNSVIVNDFNIPVAQNISFLCPVGVQG